MASVDSLGFHYDGLVRRLVETGRYASASDVVRDGLRLLEQRDAKLEALRSDIEQGLESGPAEPLDMEGIKAEARQQRQAR